MKLYYFDHKGRAEAPRLMMRLAGKEFEDITFSFEEWGAKYKAMSPTGQAPWLELEEGRVLTQSNAIAMYCAGLAGFMPPNPFQLARTEEMLRCLDEVWESIGPSFAITDEAEKLVARKALCQPDGVTFHKMKRVDSLVAACTTPFYCGDAPTLMDIQLFTYVSLLRSGYIDGLSMEFMDSFDKTSALRVKVASMPKVKEMYTGVAGFEP